MSKKLMAKKSQIKSTFFHLITIFFIMFVLGYASVPLYRLFCQKTGFGGTTQVTSSLKDIPKTPADRNIAIHFTTTVHPSLPWSFKPLTTPIQVLVGETTLAFFQATNNANQPITGVATYNVTPLKAAQYFHKIQCFCFDQQRLDPGETIDMPVLFYIDKECLNDPYMDDVNSISLSYSYYESSP